VRKLSISVMAMLAMAMVVIACSPERDLFSDTIVRTDAVQTGGRQMGGSALTSICARSSVEDTGSSGAAM